MPTEIYRRCNTVAECYEFMLAYAAQGVSSGDGSQSGGIREVLQRAADSLSGLNPRVHAHVDRWSARTRGQVPRLTFLIRIS